MCADTAAPGMEIIMADVYDDAAAKKKGGGDAPAATGSKGQPIIDPATPIGKQTITPGVAPVAPEQPAGLDIASLLASIATTVAGANTPAAAPQTPAAATPIATPTPLPPATPFQQLAPALPEDTLNYLLQHYRKAYQIV
jgi:hypothetical protein